VTALPDPAVQPAFPIRAAFLYPWFPEGWDQRGLVPYSRFRPASGRYDSADPGTIAAQARALAYGGFQAAVVSWWGVGAKSEDQRIPALLDVAGRTEPGLRFALYYEKEGTADPTVDELVGDLRYARDRYMGAPNYLRVGGRPVLFVYNADDLSCAVADRWSAATAAVDLHLVLKVFPGWRNCRAQPRGWHQYAPSDSYDEVVPGDPGVGGAVTVSPGFWPADDPGPRLARDPARWRRDVAAMYRSGADWQLVTTFNEWGEGTSVEEAVEWASASGHGTYLDTLHSASGN
jgi:hypothetical protein